MKLSLYLALPCLLLTFALPAQAQDPEDYRGLLDVLSPEAETGSFNAGVCLASCEVSQSPYHPLPPAGVGPARVVPVYPIGACNGFTNLDEVKGNFALVRSDCGHGSGVFIARDGDALGAIIFNADAPPDDDTSLRDIEWDTDVLIPHPAVFITRYRGERLLAAIEAGGEVTAVMRMNPAVSTEPGAGQGAGVGLAVWPNPGALPGIALELERPEAVRLAVYDVLGREVAVLNDGLLGAGTQRFAVTGLPAGLYLVRAEGASVQAVRRITVLR